MVNVHLAWDPHIGARSGRAEAEVQRLARGAKRGAQEPFGAILRMLRRFCRARRAGPSGPNWRCGIHRRKGGLDGRREGIVQSPGSGRSRPPLSGDGRDAFLSGVLTTEGSAT